MAEYGMIYDANSVKKQLYESNRGYNQRKTWEGMFGVNDIYGQKLDAAATNSYSNAINDAYTASTASKTAIMSGGLGQGFKQKLLSENDLAIQQAFDSYSQNLATTRQEINSGVTQNATAIQEAAMEQAKFTKDYADAHFDYLEKLYADYENGDNTLFSSKQWSKYLTDVVDGKGQPTGEKRLLTRDELLAPSFVEGENKEKQWTSLYDDQGNLTAKGLDFFDQMENQNVTSNSFGSYLAGDTYTDESASHAKRRQELLEWSQSYNPYNYTFSGTNKGTFKTMVGLSSMDNEYSFAERFGGFTKQEVDNLYSGFNKAVNDLSTASKDSKSTTKEINNVINEVQKLAVDLGIDNEFNFDEIKAQAEAYAKGTKDNGDMTWEFIGNTGSMAVGGTTAGLTVGGGYGALAGGIIGALGGIISSSINVSNQKKRNVDMAKQSKQMYTDLLNSMINYSQAKRKQAQIDFSKQYNRF